METILPEVLRVNRDWAVRKTVLASEMPLVVTRWRARVVVGRVRYWWRESERVIRWVRRVSEWLSQSSGIFSFFVSFLASALESFFVKV